MGITAQTLHTLYSHGAASRRGGGPIHRCCVTPILAQKVSQSSQATCDVSKWFCGLVQQDVSLAACVRSWCGTAAVPFCQP